MRSLRRLLGELREGFSIAGVALASNRLRTFLTTLGIVIGVMTVIAIVAIIQGLNQSFSDSLQGFGAATLYVGKYKFITTDDEWALLRNRKPIGKKELEAIEHECVRAKSIAPQTGWRSTVSGNGHEIPNVQITGTNDQYLATNGGGLKAGRFLSAPDVEYARTAAVMGADVLDMLFPGIPPEDAVGRKILVGGRGFSVVGVMERRGRFLGMSMDNNVLMPFTTFLSIFGLKRSMTIAVAGADPETISLLEDELTGLLRRVRQVAPDKPDDFSINRQEQLLKIYNQLTGALYAVAIAVGLITLVVGGIGIMNIMLVSVHERTREIGLRRALGARKRTILLQFLLESLAVSAVGGAAGTVLGLGAAQLVALVSPLAAAATPSAIVLGIAFSAAVGLLFGSWPAWRAANLDPVEALRWE
jgi:putative ABC transport system permease protein